MIRLGQNITALAAQRRLHETSSALARSYERLASGLRINSASDDPAGLAVAAGLSTDQKVYAQAIRNVNDGISLVNVADSALDQMQQIVGRLRELASQSANGVLTNAQRQSLDQERAALASEYNRIAAATEFNGRALLSTASSVTIQAGYGASGQLGLTLGAEIDRLAGDGTFSPVVSYDMAPAEHPSLAVADFNKDGNQDVAIGGWAGADNAVNLGNGDGTFRATQLFSNGGASLRDLQAADFNSDGNVDLIGISESTDRYHLQLGNGDGTFSLGTAINPNMALDIGTRFAIGDFNGDGAQDLAVSSYAADKLSVLLGNGNGSFRQGYSYSNSKMNAYTVAADVNGDSHLDLVSSGDDCQFVFLGTGDGSFQSPRSFEAYGRRQGVGDVDGDGLADLVVGSSGGVQILKGNGNGTFAAHADIAVAASDFFAIALADCNDDGVLDIAANWLEAAAQSTTIFLNQGNGTFKGPVSYDVIGRYDTALIVADMNNDEINDIVQTQPPQGAATILFGRSTATTRIPVFNLRTKDNAIAAMSVLERLQQKISSERSVIGAAQSRFEVAASNLQSLEVNIGTAAARIGDADVAEEATAMIRYQIMQQAATAVLAQANQQPALVLRLLGQ